MARGFGNPRHSRLGSLRYGAFAATSQIRVHPCSSVARFFLESVKIGLAQGQEEETLAIDIKNSIDSLGTITGETASIDILDTIFNNFCIGK